MATDLATTMRIAAAFALALAGVTPAFAAGGGALPFTFKATTANEASLQRGARAFMDYCVSCHSLKYLRYNRLAHDLSIPDELLRKYLMLGTDKAGDPITTTMPADAEKWFGRAPPDLSLTARERGPDWVYSYLLSFYIDPSKPTGVNNLVLPGASMPHVLGELQGWQRLAPDPAAAGHHGPKFERVLPGTLSEGEYKAFIGDLTNFLVYAAEPVRNHRVAVGVLALLFVVVFWGLAYLLKVEYWKDVH
jgi:ubiquinol-cytochrome c reductase cytochrome c1 subunit